jgi:hypothetical protein
MPKNEKHGMKISSPMQTGHVGSSVDPTGGMTAISADDVYCTATINRTWHTSTCSMEQQAYFPYLEAVIRKIKSINQPTPD